MSKPLLLFTLVALSTAGPTAAIAQQQRIAGRVTDSTTGSPVADAELSLPGTATVVTDSTGRFEITGIRPGRYVLQVRHIGYGAHEDSLTVGRRDVVLTILISPRAIELQPVNVEAAARERSATSRSYVIDRAQIESVLGRARHLGDVVRTYIPGATMYETRAGYICLEFRGARGARMRGCNAPLIVVDGVAIPGGGQFLRDTPPEEIDRIEFVPASAGASRYGPDSQHGALVIRTRRSGAAENVSAPASAARAADRGYPAYEWRRELAGHPWQRSVAGATVGNLLGVAAGLAALGCLGSGDGECLSGRSPGAGLAALTLPIAGATLGARILGATDQSRGNPLAIAVAAAIPTLIGFAMYRDGETAEFGSSRIIGGVLVIGVAPLAASIADGLFRKPQGPVPEIPPAPR